MKTSLHIANLLFIASHYLSAQVVVDASNTTPDKVATSLMPVPIFNFAAHTVAFSPNGEILATGDGTGTVRLWNLHTGELKTSIRAHTNWAFSIVWSRDGEFLVTGGGDNAVRLFELANPARSERPLVGHSNDVHAVAITRDGSHIVSAGDDKDIVVWNANNGRQVRRWRGHDEPIPSLHLSPDDQWVATSSRDDSIRIWNLKTGALQHALIGHTGDVLSVRFSPDGKTLASASYDQTVRLWDAATGQERRLFKGHTNRVFGVAFSPDGSRLASAGDSTLRIWNIANGDPLNVIAPGDVIETHGRKIPEDLSAVTFSPDGRTLAVSSTTGTITLIDAASGKVMRRLVPNSK